MPIFPPKDDSKRTMVSVRMDESLKERLAEIASNEGRSLGETITHLLDWSAGEYEKEAGHRDRVRASAKDVTKTHARTLEKLAK